MSTKELIRVSYKNHGDTYELVLYIKGEGPIFASVSFLKG